MLDLYNQLLDLLFPKQCVICDSFGSYLCNRCRYKHLNTQTQNICHVCKNFTLSNLPVHRSCKYLSDIDRVIVCFHYNKHIEKIVKLVKYDLCFDIVNLIIELMLEGLDVSKLHDSIFIPVPLHKSKKNLRGFNQAELIARKLCFHLNRMGINVEVINLIERKRNTKTQVGMDKFERQLNLKSAFEINSKILNSKFHNKSIWLIDDVMTTGTTLEECAVLLKQNRAEEVNALVFARG